MRAFVLPIQGKEGPGSSQADPLPLLRLQPGRRYGSDGMEYRMFLIVGILLVSACVIIGFLMEKGKLAVLVQPAELITIGGAAIGTVLAANPMHILKKMIAGLLGVIKGSPFSK